MKIIKKALAAATSSVMAASMCVTGIGSLGTANAADKTAVQLVEDMGQGWNLGNTFDCTNTWTSPLTPTAIETAWGNPVTTEAMIKEIKKSGFNTVRIPITWSQMMSSDGSSINADYVARIKEVVGYVLDNGMYAIINTHHDEDWIKSESNTTKFSNLWKAIATAFASYDEHLVFEGTNEVSFSTSAQQQTFNQAFVDTVRATGGNNAKRLLLVCAPSNNTSKLLNDFTAPTDSAKMIAVSCHYYEPPQFCVAKTTSTWGHQETWGSNADKTTLQNDFDKLETKFINNGIPVIIGEYGVDTSTEGGKDKESMYAFLKEVATYALNKEGMCPVVWDMSVYNNGAGDMAYFNRTNLSWYDSKIGEIFASAANGGSSDTTKSDRITFNAADIAATDKNGKTYWQIDLKPYKEYGVNPESAVVNFTITQTDSANTEMSGDIAASFNVKTTDGTLAYSNIDTVVGINDSTAVIDLMPEAFNIAWDDAGAVTETATGVIDMDYLKLENWWTWCDSGEATITIDSVTLIFDGNVPVDADQITTTTTTETATTTTTTSTTTATETTTTTATTTSDPDVTTESYTGVYANAYLAGSVGSNSVWSAAEAADTENMAEVDGNGTFEVQWNLAEGSETIDFLMLEIESIDEFDSYFTTDTFPNLTLTIDHFYIDGVEQTLADEPDAVNLRYFENTGKTRAYFRANWGANGGVDFGISGDTTVEKTIKVVFTINGTYKDSENASSDKVWGDADGNGELTISDIVMVLQYSVNKTKYPLDEKNMPNCDMNDDGDINSSDAFFMQQLDANVISVADLPIK